MFFSLVLALVQFTFAQVGSWGRFCCLHGGNLAWGQIFAGGSGAEFLRYHYFWGQAEAPTQVCMIRSSVDLKFLQIPSGHSPSLVLSCSYPQILAEFCRPIKSNRFLQIFTSPLQCRFPQAPHLPWHSSQLSSQILAGSCRISQAHQSLTQILADSHRSSQAHITVSQILAHSLQILTVYHIALPILADPHKINHGGS